MRGGNQGLENCHWNRWVCALVGALERSGMMSERGAIPGYCFEGFPSIVVMGCAVATALYWVAVVFDHRRSRVLVDTLRGWRQVFHS